jgi:hypothetical protein
MSPDFMQRMITFVKWKPYSEDDPLLISETIYNLSPFHAHGHESKCLLTVVQADRRVCQILDAILFQFVSVVPSSYPEESGN